jgi:hypothetical protein
MNHQTLLATILLSMSVGASARISLPTESPRIERPLVITECEAPQEIGASWQRVSSTDKIVAVNTDPGSLRLIRRNGTLDVLLESGKAGSWLATSAGTVEIINADRGTFHLVLQRPTGPEHLLFLLDADGAGDLVWSSAGANAATACAPISNG